MKIKYKLLLILSLSALLQANNDIEEFNKDNLYQSMHKQFSAATKEVNRRDTKLLIPTDIENTLKVIKEYKYIYKNFIKDRKELKISNESAKFHSLYLDAIEKISDIKLIDSMQWLARNDYEMRILKRLKKDFIEGIFSDKEKNNLIGNLKNLLLLDKFSIYETQKNLNIFYANNMKKYFSTRMKVSLDLIETKSNKYQNFIDTLNRGEFLILEGLKLDDFSKFQKFVDDLEVSKDEARSLLKIKDSNPSKFSKLYVDYWIRGQVYGRYLGVDKSITPILRHIEKEKLFFETL